MFAITRSKTKTLSQFMSDKACNEEQTDSVPSRFLDEIPVELVKISEPEREVDESEVDDVFARIRMNLKAKA